MDEQEEEFREMDDKEFHRRTSNLAKILHIHLNEESTLISMTVMEVILIGTSLNFGYKKEDYLDHISRVWDGMLESERRRVE